MPRNHASSRGRPEVFGGQPDPNDLSRFTIDYRLADIPGVIEGQLLDSGDIALKLRPGSPDVMELYRQQAAP